MTATAASWDHSPFTVGVSIHYHATFNGEQLARLQAGFIPEEMDQRWFIFFDDPYLYFHRSWTGDPIYRLTLEATAHGAKVIDAQWHHDLAAENGADPTYQAKLLEFLIDTRLLGTHRTFPRRFSTGFKTGSNNRR